MDDYDFGELLVLRHTPAVGLGGIQPMLDQRATRRPWRAADLGAGDPVPELDDRSRGILVLGGFMSVDDRDEHPWLDAEVELLRAARAADVPVLGICLGAQLLGVAHGGEVTHRDTADVGLFRLRRVDEEDPLSAGWPDDGPVVQANKDVVSTLPPDAVAILAAGDGPAPASTPAWRIGTTVHALQFHPEADATILRSWIEHGDLAERAAGAGIDADEFVATVERSERFVRSVGLAIVGRWLDGVVGASDPSPRKHRKAA